MAENIEKEFDEQDIQTVKELQAKYATTTAQIGQVEVELHLMEKRFSDLREMRDKLFQTYEALQTQESELVNTLNEKYGDGVLDLDSGKFISSAS